VQISNPTNATLVRGTGTGAIINDDVQATVVPQLSIGSASVVEGDEVRRPLKFAVTLSSPARAAVEVDWHTRAGGTASQSTDYAEAHGRLSIPAGEVTAVVKVQIRPDLVNEPNEVFTVRLSDPAGATIYGVDGYGTILDDD
jgi:chitinase